MLSYLSVPTIKWEQVLHVNIVEANTEFMLRIYRRASAVSTGRLEASFYCFEG